METVALFVAVFVVWAVLVALSEWLFPPKPKHCEYMEDMMNDGVQTSLRLLGLGVVSIGIVLASAMALGFV